MKANVGNVERIIRGVAGAGLLIFGLVGGLEATMGYVAMGVGVVLLFTAVSGFCPPYAIFGINTCGTKSSES